MFFHSDSLLCVIFINIAYNENNTIYYYNANIIIDVQIWHVNHKSNTEQIRNNCAKKVFTNTVSCYVKTGLCGYWWK